MDALPRAALLADDGADARELTGHAAVRADDVVERVGDLSFEPRHVARESDGEIAAADGLQGVEELPQVERGLTVGRPYAAVAVGLRRRISLHGFTPTEGAPIGSATPWHSNRL